MSNVALLVSQLQDGRIEVRAQAAEALCHLGEEARPAAPEIVKACADDEMVGQWAFAALEQIGPPSPESCGELTDLVGDANEAVAFWAVTLLGRLRSAADSSAGALTTALSSSQYLCVRERAAWALGQIGHQSSAVLAALEQASDSREPRLARLATRVLAELDSQRDA